MKIYLHIGGGKCASSSIQQHFSYNNIQKNFAYGALMQDGSILSGDDLELRAMEDASNYVNSSALKYDLVSDNFKLNLKTSLEKLSKNYNSLLLSSEGWYGKHNFFEGLSEILSAYDVEVIFILRAPVDYTNSAYWQWDHWGDVDIDEKLKTFNISEQYLNAYRNFSALSFVKKVNLLHLQRDILNQIYEIIGLDLSLLEKDNKINNASSSAELLYFLSLRNSLRPGVHSSGAEFVLNKYLKKISATPWVLSRQNVEEYLALTKDTALELAKIIENENILENPAWWDISYYENKIAKYTREINLSYEGVESMLEESLLIIANIQKEIDTYTAKGCKINKLSLCYRLLRVNFKYYGYAFLSKIFSKNKKLSAKLIKYKNMLRLKSIISLEKFKREKVSYDLLLDTLELSYYEILRLDRYLRELKAMKFLKERK